MKYFIKDNSAKILSYYCAVISSAILLLAYSNVLANPARLLDKCSDKSAQGSFSGDYGDHNFTIRGTPSKGGAKNF